MIIAVDTSYLKNPFGSEPGKLLGKLQNRAKRTKGRIVVASCILEDLLHDTDDWVRRARHFKYLARTPELVDVAQPLGVQGRFEIQTGTPSRKRVDATATTLMRQLLRSGCDNDAKIEAAWSSWNVQEALKEARLTHTNPEELARLREQASAMLKSELTLPKCRDLVERTDGRLEDELAKYIAEKARAPQQVATSLPVSPDRVLSQSVSIRLMAALMLLTTEDVAVTKTRVGEKEARNTHWDLEHLVVGTFADEFHTADRDLHRRYRIIKRSLHGARRYVHLAT